MVPSRYIVLLDALLGWSYCYVMNAKHWTLCFACQSGIVGYSCYFSGVGILLIDLLNIDFNGIDFAIIMHTVMLES